MAVRNTMLAMDSESSVKQDIRGVLRILDDPESMEQALEQRNCMTLSNTRLLLRIRDLANKLEMVAPMVPFGTGFAEIPMIHHTNPAGISIFLFPPSLDDNGNGGEIRPAYISDGFNTWVNESEGNLFLYLASNFSEQDQEELFRKILDFLKTNFTASNGNGTSDISRCVKEFCGSIERIISSETAHEQ